MSQLVANALWGLKYGAMLAFAFALGLVVTFVVQGPAAFAAYHPSIRDVLVGLVGTWLVGGLIVGVGRPLVRWSVGRLVLSVVGGVFVAMGVLVLVFGFSELPVGTALLAGTLLGLRAGLPVAEARSTVAESAQMNLPAKYQRNLTRQQKKTAQDWDVVMSAWLEANEEPKLGFQFRLQDESSARALAERLREAGADFVAAEPRRFALRRRWMVHGYESAPAKQVDQVNSWIDKMVSVGAEYGADFYGWSPGRALPAA
jgi:hypothetical protein